MRTTRTRTLGLLAAVALIALGCGDGGDGGDAERSNDLTIEAGDLFYEPEEFAASAGEITFTMENTGAVEHDLIIEETEDEIIGELEPGESASGSVTLEAGTYTLYCAVVGHREAGMEATLDVE